MDNNFEILKNIDNDELYNKTYISIDNLQAIKSKDFKSFTRFKLMGFIDILSKRLNLDLSLFREEATHYFDSLEPVVVENEVKPKQSNIPIEKKTLLFGLMGLGAIVLAGLIYSVVIQEPAQDLTEVKVSPPSTVVVDPTSVVVEEKNITDEQNSTTQQQETNTKEAVASKSGDIIKIVPKKKVWIGIINLETKEKKDYTTADELVIDKSINQIIVVNGTYLSLMVGSEEKIYDYDGRVRFMVKDGKIEEISYTYFKELNDGKAWK